MPTKSERYLVLNQRMTSRNYFFRASKKKNHKNEKAPCLFCSSGCSVYIKCERLFIDVLKWMFWGHDHEHNDIGFSE